jgi:hypothetical protein
MTEERGYTASRDMKTISKTTRRKTSKQAPPSTYDFLKEAGLIGCAPGLPKDLSTNKRYFAGFGKSKRSRRAS